VKVSGNATLNATPQQVWAALNDPAVLVRTIPGCERLDEVGPDRYRMTVTAGVASIKGSHLGDVTLADHLPYSAFTLRASGSGTPGTVSADVRVALDEQPDGTTLVRYDADAVVGGTVGGVGQRVLGGVARRMAAEFFSAVDTHLTASPSGLAGPSPTAGPAATGAPTPPAARSDVPTPPAGIPVPLAGTRTTTYTRPRGAAPARTVRVDVRNPLPAAIVGAAIALAGVLVGWRITRRPRGRPQLGTRGDHVVRSRYRGGTASASHTISLPR
jgi:uncharacterized protein